MQDLHELSALELARAIRDRVISPVELTHHYLDRIERIDPHVGAYVTVTAERALEQARRLEKDLPDGPLAGVPIPVKDLNLVKDVPIMFGSATYREFVSPVDDTVVERLREAGTVMLGKTATPEFGLPCYTETDVSPPSRSPWDTGRSAGGSSGGAAAAVAAGL
ncbi:amidase, partial [Nonomuraea lactucae]|uniref:amidase n=1 Tax=Nonomuraea lactucae TaxID=2249762 RepID=UPI0019649AE4